MPFEAARKGDDSTSIPPPPGLHTPKLGPGPGSLNVKIGGQNAWRCNVDTHMCTMPIAPPPAPAVPHGPEKCYLGSMTVMINNQMACRVLDMLVAAGAPNLILAASGCRTVQIGDIPFGLAMQSAIDDY